MGPRRDPCAFGVCLWLAAALLSSAAADPMAARAEVMLDFALQIEAPSSAICTSAAVLQRAIEERVGSLVFLDNAEPARRIRVVVTQDEAAQTWTADIAMRDEGDAIVGERRVSAQGSQCAGLDEALIVVITTLIGIADAAAHPEPDEAEEEPDDAADKGGPVAAPTTGPAQREAVTAPGAARSEPLHIDVAASIGARADLGFLPGVAPSGVAALHLDFGDWAIVIGAAFAPYAVEDLDLGAFATFMAALGDLSLCLEAAHPLGAALGFCAGAQAGVIRVVTSGLYSTSNPVEAVVRAVVGPRLHVPFHRSFGMLLGLDAAFPILAPRFYFVDGDGERRFYHSVDLGISALVGFYLRFSS